VLFERSIAVNVQGLVNFLDVLGNTSSLFYAASSHVFGRPDSPIQDERTAFRPDSIYGITKVAGIHACHYYRNTRNVRASVGILYNHESPLRKPDFVTRRIVQSAVAISRGSLEELVLGDLNAAVDWGYAPDYVDAMLRIALLDDADDFIIATGETHTVAEFVELAFACVRLDWQKHVRVDDRRLRRTSDSLAGDSTRLRQRTGWAPTISFSEMIRRLVAAERARASA
jgi:GDPmannose 4,6-dehydratase